jgi:uncharacterized protein YdhG (YjbR/CyaY superfamily)
MNTSTASRPKCKPFFGARIQKAAARYAGEKGNLRFPLDEPIPYDLIARITALRVKQDAAKSKRRRKKALR